MSRGDRSDDDVSEEELSDEGRSDGLDDDVNI